MTCFPLKTDGTFLSIQMSAIFLGADSLCYKNRWIASNISIQNLHPNSQEVTILRHSSLQGGAGFFFSKLPSRTLDDMEKVVYILKDLHEYDKYFPFLREGFI